MPNCEFDQCRFGQAMGCGSLWVFGKLWVANPWDVLAMGFLQAMGFPNPVGWQAMGLGKLWV